MHNADSPFMQTQTKEVRNTTNTIFVLLANTSSFKICMLKSIVFQIYGSTQFFLSKELFQPLYTSIGISNDILLHIAACVTDNSTGKIYLEFILSTVCIVLMSLPYSVNLCCQGFKVNKTVEVHLMKNTFQLQFQDFPLTIRPSLHFSSKVSQLISLYQFKIYL